MKIGIYIPVLLLLLMACSEPSVQILEPPKVESLQSSMISSRVADPIVLRFKSQDAFEAELILQNSYGTTALRQHNKSGLLEFRLPDHFNKLAGVASWILVSERKQIHQGTINIMPELNKETNLETYLGPRNLIAGSSDAAMIITLATDRFDNPLHYDTPVEIHKYFNEDTIVFQDSTNGLLTWRRIGAENQKGRIFLKSSVREKQSKELALNILSANPGNFEISFKRDHVYADGNQKILFYTDPLRDQFKNTVEDGTLVHFLIIDSGGNKLSAYANTVNGVAEAKMIHPEFPDSWEVMAYVPGVAHSNTIRVPFKAAVKDFELRIDPAAHHLIAGPIYSFMGQLIPDGSAVKVMIVTQKGKMMEHRLVTEKGVISIDISQLLGSKDKVKILVESFGISKEISIQNSRILNE